jgi:ubiquinone/menaquinone biosynthesis C-methylase UbiE
MRKGKTMKASDLQGYHTHIANTYDKRSGAHDRSEWHQKTALKLAEEMPPCVSESVLDIGTGTGSIAFHAATIVGPSGKVIGVDLSEGMLTQANTKLAETGLRNIEFILGDMEHLKLPVNSIDKIYCASAFFCVLDPLATLQHWLGLLKSGGSLAFHATPETSYFWVSIARDVLSKYGFSYRLNTPTGTIEKTRNLLKKSGFKKIEIREEKNGYFELLANHAVPFRFHDDEHDIYHHHPIINLDHQGNIIELKYNAHLASIFDLPEDIMHDYYLAYRELMTRVRSPKYRITLKLTEGTMAVFDNRRVLHGREAFEPTGKRHLRGCYIDRTEFQSRLRVLRKRLDKV